MQSSVCVSFGCRTPSSTSWLVQKMAALGCRMANGDSIYARYILIRARRRLGEWHFMYSRQCQRHSTSLSRWPFNCPFLARRCPLVHIARLAINFLVEARVNVMPRPRTCTILQRLWHSWSRTTRGRRQSSNAINSTKARFWRSLLREKCLREKIN